MVSKAKPFDGNFTTWAHAQTPGEADLNRIQNDLLFMSSPPFMMLNRSGTAVYGSTLVPVDLMWDTIVETNSNPTSEMVASGLTNKIICPYVGDWEIKAKVRSQFNNTAGSVQIFLYKTYTSGHADVLLDEDESPCTAIGAVHLRINCDTQIVQSDLALGAGFKIQYVQNSGGNATVTTDSTIYNAWPRFSARWVGTSS